MDWLAATLEQVRTETPTAKTLVFDVAGWHGHLPGQHIDVRLTAEDGYSTQRSYSLAAPKDGTRVELTVQSVPDGEVSPYLTDVLDVGDQVELRGPVGRWFVWRPDEPQPVLLIGGGSGIVPLMAMVRARARACSTVPFRVIYSVREPSEMYYADELRETDGLEVTRIFTRRTPPEVSREAGRITADDIAAHGWPTDVDPSCYICGPTGFVETAADLLVEMGIPAGRIKTERFGPTGV